MIFKLVFYLLRLLRLSMKMTKLTLGFFNFYNIKTVGSHVYKIFQLAKMQEKLFESWDNKKYYHFWAFVG